jgi:signal transduction histidine kinase
VGKIVQAWNWGSLDLRIADRRGDDLGNTAVLLDQLVDHFEQDERDLDELRQRNMLLTDQVRALTVVEERNRLARELHDSVKQHLFSLAMTLSAVRTQLEGLQQIPEDLKTMVEDVESSAQTAQRETTRLIGDLRPGSLQERGLAVSLNDFTLLFGAKEHLLVYLDVQGQEPSLAPLVAEALYRVAQEALHNVARHAQATRVDLQLQYLPGRVRLALQDNGIGFDVSQPSRGLGLANMQERMMEVGGRLDIESQYGRGTCITAEVDLVAARERQQAEILEQGQTALIPTMDHWPWLGQKLVIPVGQTWPWLPADTAHLRQPLVELVGVPLIFKSEPRLLGLRKCCRFEMGSQPDSWVRIRHTWRGFSWKCDGARWQLHNYGGLSRRMVLFRNGQPVAALQYRGRQLHAWSEVVYDGRGYRISQDAKTPERYILRDHTGDLLLTVHHKIPTEVTLERPLPVQLIILVALRILEENLFYPK